MKNCDLEINCSKHPESELDVQQLKIMITNAKVMDGGLFTSSYVNYGIYTKQLESTVERRFSDFYWLRSIFVRDFVGVYVGLFKFKIPPIPQKSIKKYEKDFLESRFDGLQKFLNTIAEHPELLRSPALVGFLKLIDSTQFQEFKNEIDATLPPFDFIPKHLSLEAFEGFSSKCLRSISGVCRVRLNKDLHQYSVQAENMLNASEESYDRLKKLSLELCKGLEKVSCTLASMAEEIRELETINRNFNETVDEGKWSDVGSLYNDLNERINCWGHQIEKTSLIVKEHLFKTFKYSRKECEAAIQMINIRNECGQAYFGAVKHLSEEKDLLLDKKDPSKWRLDPKVSNEKIAPEDLLKNRNLAKHFMMPEKREALNQMRLTFGFLNELMVKEMTWLGGYKAMRYAKSIGNMNTERIEILDEERRASHVILERIKSQLPILVEQMSLNAQSSTPAT